MNKRMEPDATIIYNGKVITEEDGVIERGVISWRGERLVYAGPLDRFPGRERLFVHPGDRTDERSGEHGADAANGRQASESAADNGPHVIDANGDWVLPGFIDVHVHGGYGHDFMDAAAAAYDAITQFHASHGTAAMLATTVTASREALGRVLAAAEAYRQGPMPYAELLGVHLEGPFISPKWPGAQNPAFIVEPQPEWVQQWEREHPGMIRLLTLAPEQAGAQPLIAWLSERGIVAACGHTDAGYDCVQDAVAHGLRHAVHTFNAMKGLHHREPGTVGAVLGNAAITAEVIADGHHVHPACIRLLAQLKAPDRLLLITDAVAAAGLFDGDYELGGLEVVVKDGVARLRHGGNLAGSTLTMLGAFQYMVREVGLAPELVSRLASGNPARLLNQDTEMGSLAAGKLANVLRLSPELALRTNWIRGRKISLLTK